MSTSSFAPKTGRRRGKEDKALVENRAFTAFLAKPIPPPKEEGER